MRALKIVGWSLLGVVALVVLAMLLVVWLVDPNDYKDEVAAAVKQETGRDLELDGDLHLSVFPWLAIELGPARLGNPEGFGPGPFVSVQKADVGVKLFPLLRGTLEVRRLELDGLQLNLVKNEQGRTNWEDLTEPAPTAPQPAEPADGALPDIAGLSIKNSALDYRDLGTSAHWRLRDLSVDTGRLHEGDPFDIDMAFNLDEGEGSAATALKLKSEVTLDSEAERYAFKDLDLDATLKAAEAGRKDRRVVFKVPALEADLAQQTLAAPQFTLQVAGAELNGALAGTKIVDAPAFTGSLALKPVSPRELMRELEAEEPRTTDPKALSTLAFESKLKATDKSVNLEDLKLTLDDSTMTGRLGIEDLDTMAIRFDLTVDRIDIDRYLEPEAKEEKPAEAEPVELPVEGLEALNARGTLAIGALKLAGIKMGAVKVALDARDGLTRINPSQAKLYGGSQRGGLVLDTRSSVPKMSLDQKLSGVDVTGLMGDLFDSKRLSGKATANAVLAARGKTDEAMIRTLDGRIDFDVANGAIEGKDLWYELRRARALYKREPAPNVPDTGRTAFRSLKGSATITDGVVNNPDFIMEMDYLKVLGSGTLDLKSQKLDYKLQTNLYKIPPENAGAEMQDMKAAEIPVRVSGTLADMKIRPDFDALVKAEAKQQVEEKQKEITDKLKDKLNKWLGGEKN